MEESSSTTTEKPDENVENKQRNQGGKSVNLPLAQALCLLDVLDVSVTDSEKRFNAGTVNIRDGYTVYLIETKSNANKVQMDSLLKFSNIWRRYSEFEVLKEYLQESYPYIVVPPLPEKKIMFSWQASPTDLFHHEFVDRRKAGLENFLLRVASHKTLSFDTIFIKFLQDEDEWNKSIAGTGYIGKADAKIRSLGATLMLKKPDKKFEETKNYSNELHNNISNVLKMRTKLADRQYCLYQLHANYSRVFLEWSGVEKEMAVGLQKAARMINAYVSLASGLNEEEQFADQMKEYLFYAESVRNVCKKKEALQYEVECCSDNYNAKVAARDYLAQGNVSFISRWFKPTDTDEVRELKLQQMETQIQEAEGQYRRSVDNGSKFSELAQKDIEQFEAQKVKDLKETLILFAILQIKNYKKSLSIWTNLRECFENM